MYAIFGMLYVFIYLRLFYDVICIDKSIPFIINTISSVFTY